jgi:uncharacterized RDD family membrane protein YckC
MAKDAAMPAGVTIAGLGARALVSVLDVVPLAFLSLLVSLLAAQNLAPTVILVVGIAATLLSLGWLVFLWWGYATRGQGLPAKWLRVRVLRLSDGRPLGWGRWFLRVLVWYGSMIVPIVWLVLVVMMIVHPRRRGWHDLAGQSVVVQAKAPAAPSAEASPVQRLAVASANMVSLPAHLVAPHVPFVAPEAPRPESVADRGNEPITALPDFGGPAAVPAPSSFAPLAGVPWNQWGVQPPAQPTVYPEQLPYNAPGAYPLPPQPQYAPQQPPTGYAPQQQLPYPQQPPAAYAPQPQPVPPPAPMIVAEEDDLTRTHLAPVGRVPGPPRKATDGWQLGLDDGRTVPVTGLVLIGRNPRPQPDEQAQLVQAGVESRMVSKTHLAVGLDHRGLYVMDRGSTNGTAIANSGGRFEPCAPGDPVRVREGQIVSFGDRYLEVRRNKQ